MNGPAPFLGSQAIAISPDGRNVYVAASRSNAIAVFRRNARTGRLTQSAATERTELASVMVVAPVRHGRQTTEKERAMPEYAPGTPSWIELSSPNTDDAAQFYGALMGWSATDPGPAETGGYRMFQQDDKNIGGLMGIMQEGQPTAWATYVSVADADETAAKVKAAGGTVVLEPMDVMDIGRMAFFSDPTGAVFGVWQPKTFTGADLVNVPVSLCWNEVLTRDAAANKAFYPAVFGWVAGRPSFEGAPETYTVWELDGKPVGGMMQMSDEYFPAEVPPHWGVCFAVSDCDATVAKARELGASITSEPMDMPIGRFAGIIDPQGASFTVMQPTSA